MQADPAEIRPLLGDLSDIPADYIRDVAHTKRFLERWVADPKYRDAYHADPAAAIASLGLELTPDQLLPLIDNAAATELTRQLAAGTALAPPVSVLRYRAFVEEKFAHRAQVRRESESSNPRMAAWRARQLNRCRGELGLARTDAIVHAPAAFELTKGCTVGCWFCGVAAPKFDHWWPYTPENGELWRGCLSSLRDSIGDCVRQGFLYWATDPLDNPDYERFLVDFHAVTGRCPQTTTALGQKDIERTRRLLRLAHSLGSSVDRFSIIALNSLSRIHEALTPEELLRVECVPQNKEAADHYRKSNAGRARRFTEKRKGELVSEEQSSTIACVSGFLFNMTEKSVQLVSPCNADENWPLGYWVYERGAFETPEDLRELIDGMIERHMRPALRLSDTVRLRRDVQLSVEGGELLASSRGPALVFRGQAQPDDLAAVITEGAATVEDLALRRERTAGVPMVETLSLLDHMFAEGLLHEAPPVPEPGSAIALGIPTVRELATRGAE